MRAHTVTGGGGLRLHACEWGNRDGPPILFIHGWSQSHLCWHRQYNSALADEFRLVAFDLRGHGMSEAPRSVEHYSQGRSWAADVAAVIDQLDVDRPVLVGWSYGGVVVCDYVREYGQDRIAAINLAGAIATATEPAFDAMIGPAFLKHFAGATAEELSANIRAVRGLVHAFAATSLPTDDLESLLCAAAAVPAQIRTNLFAREIDSDDVLQGLRLPLLVSHGRADAVVLPAMAEHILSICATAHASWYDDVGHVPFLEATSRFNHELAELTRAMRT
jgi:pimeloyl-ACP methyl ester carboxylesterase